MPKVTRKCEILLDGVEQSNVIYAIDSMDCLGGVGLVVSIAHDDSGKPVADGDDYLKKVRTGFVQVRIASA